MSRTNRLENPAPVAGFQHHETISDQFAAIEKAILDMRTQIFTIEHTFSEQLTVIERKILNMKTHILAEEVSFPLENDSPEPLNLLYNLDDDESLVFDNSELSELEDTSDWDDFSEVFGLETLSQCLDAIKDVKNQEREEIFRSRNLADELFHPDSGDSDASDFSNFMMRMASREAAELSTAALNNEETLEETIEEQVERFFETLVTDLENLDPEPLDENMEFMPLLHNHPIEDWLLDLPKTTPDPSETDSSSSLSTLSTLSSSTRRIITRPEFYPKAQEFFTTNEEGTEFINPFTQPHALRTPRADFIEAISPRTIPRPREETPSIPARNPVLISRQPALAHPAFYSEAQEFFKINETGNDLINPFTQHPPSRNSQVREQIPSIPTRNPERVRNINQVVQPNSFIDSALPLEDQDVADCWLNAEELSGSFWQYSITQSVSQRHPLSSLDPALRR